MHGNLPQFILLTIKLSPQIMFWKEFSALNQKNRQKK